MIASRLCTVLCITAALALTIGAGCSSSAEEPNEEGSPQVDTDDSVAENAKTGAVISSSSGAIGGGGGGVISPPPLEYSGGHAPISCKAPCYGESDACVCPGGYGYESSIVCPSYAPYPRYVFGRWRCYTKP